jgi:hypothetical protein
MKEISIGQRVCAAVISHQLGISMERALKLYILGCRIHPSWEEIGTALLNFSSASGSEPAPEMENLLDPSTVAVRH